MLTRVWIASVIATGQVAGLVAKNQLAWLTALQTRIAVTAGILGGMKSIKLAGLTNRTFSTIHSLRVTELEASKKLRRVMIWVILLSRCPFYAIVFTFLTHSQLSATRSSPQYCLFLSMLLLHRARMTKRCSLLKLSHPLHFSHF